MKFLISRIADDNEEVRRRTRTIHGYRLHYVAFLFVIVSKDSSCPNRFYALKTLSTSPLEEYDYVQIATPTSCVHVLVHPVNDDLPPYHVFCYLCTIRYL